MTEDQIKYMVDRFLMWCLPEHFNPDCGISFTPIFNHHAPGGPERHQPVGTNLFDAQQATAMVRHMIEGMPGGYAEAFARQMDRADKLEEEVAQALDRSPGGMCGKAVHVEKGEQNYECSCKGDPGCPNPCGGGAK